MKYQWSRNGGYEVSSKGDTRFSAFYARMPDGRSIEEHYQCDIKGYDLGGTNWRIGKGKPPIRSCDLWEEYLSLWRVWASFHKLEIEDLKKRSELFNGILSDMFANTNVNQARALAVILNETEKKEVEDENNSE